MDFTTSFTKDFQEQFSKTHWKKNENSQFVTTRSHHRHHKTLLEDGTGYMYEDGGYVWSEGDYTPHNPWGFGVNPWRVIIEEGEVRNELDSDH